jgi:acetoin utilization deacetylase AcuC-like enzyme
MTAADIKNYNYGAEHPMKPKRVAMTHDLIVNYDMYHDMKVYVGCRPHPALLLCHPGRTHDVPLS